MRPRRLSLLLSAIALLALEAGLRARIATRPTDLPELESVHVEIPPRIARSLFLSFNAVAADVLWVQFLQDVPLSPADDATGRALASRLRSVIALDPGFRAANLHGSVLLSVLGNQPCAALSIAEAGVRRFPLDWRLPFQAGYLCFAELGDTACAERNMHRAASSPGAPNWLPGLVARFLAANSRAPLAVEYLRDQLSHTTDPRLRAEFEERLLEAHFTVALEQLDAAVREYRLRHDGAMPDSLEALVRERIVDRIPPKDPLGGTFYLGSDGRVHSSTGRHGLQPMRSEGGLEDVPARLAPERLLGRTPDLLGHEPFLFFDADRVATAGGVESQALQAFAVLREIADDPAHAQLRTNATVLLGRAMMAADLRRLRAAQVSLLQEGTSGASTQAIAARARVPDRDPFGYSWAIDAHGKISEHAGGRHPLLSIGSGGAASCQ